MTLASTQCPDNSDKLAVEKLESADGKAFDFNDVLLIADEDGKEVELGSPVLKGKKVTATTVKTFKEDKITVIKYKAKSRYRRKIGHRQQKSLLKISKIS